MHGFFARASAFAALGLLWVAPALYSLTSPAPAQAANASLITASYLGGSSSDYGRAIATDTQGNIYVAGDLFSSSVLGFTLGNSGSEDLLVAKFSPDAKQLLGMIAVGSVGQDRVGGMALTPAGEVVLLVETDGADFPLKNAQTTSVDLRNPGALLKINAAMDDLVFSTFTDFTVESGGKNVGVDSAGNIVVAGYHYNPTNRARDLQVERFTANGQRFASKIWDTGVSDERSLALKVQPNGSVLIAGFTEGWIVNDFATTPGAYQTVCGRKLHLGSNRDCDGDAFVMMLDANNATTYASFLGGSGDDRAVGVGMDAQGAIYVLGTTISTDFPTKNAHQAACKLSDPELGCYYDMFVTKFAPGGASLEYSTYLASGDAIGLDYPSDLVVDTQGNATVVGWTASAEWPTKNAFQPTMSAAPCPNAFQDRLCFDSVVSTFTPSGQLNFSSYLGGKGDELAYGVALGSNGSIYVVGSSGALDFPATPGVVQPTLRSGIDMFFARIGGTGAVPAPVGNERLYIPQVVR